MLLRHACHGVLMRESLVKISPGKGKDGLIDDQELYIYMQRYWWKIAFQNN